MARFSNNSWVTRSLLFLTLAVGLCPGQTNTTIPWLTSEPPGSVKKAPPQPPDPGDAASFDAAAFFAKYKEAVALLTKKKNEEAGITIDLLARNLRTSPWLEIAMMKHAQLVEQSNDRVAEEDYTLLRERLANSPYFEGEGDKVKLFGVALQGAVDAGLNRLRLRRVRDALSRYFGRYAEYPESLAKLAILGYTDMENIRSVNNQLFRYTPQSPKMDPFVSYKSFDLEKVDQEPFIAVNAPILEATSQISEKPLKYAAVIRTSNKGDSVRIVEDQTIDGYFVAAIAHDGVILSTPTRIIVLATP
ncbi:MAG: hypothetical protein PCFJNLEI_03009 [Verrucomicrobiae bacterium]|nr:hypothetical protein [Verrucomicrobiae bacterium]